METSLVTCVICPKGCSISVNWSEENGEKVIEDIKGNSCRRGWTYASSEVVHPVRVLSSTVRIRNSDLNLLPVRSRSPLPKEVLPDAMKTIKNTVVEGPVRMGDVIISDIASTGIDMIACRDAGRKE